MPPAGPKSKVDFTAEGKLKRPSGYPPGYMLACRSHQTISMVVRRHFPEFHAVYIDPDSFAQYEKTGEFPDGTVMIKELVSVGDHEATSGKGYFMGDSAASKRQLRIQSVSRTNRELGVF